MKNILFAISVIILGLPGIALAQQSRGAVVESISNERSSFVIRVDVDRQDRVYARNDLLRATVTSSEDGYLYLFYRDAQGKTSVLFPNNHNKDNFVRKNQPVTVPSDGGGFQIRIDAPYGDELLKAVVSKTQLQGADLDRWTKSGATSVDEKSMERFAKSLPTGNDSYEKTRWSSFRQPWGQQRQQNQYGQQQGQQNQDGRQQGQQDQYGRQQDQQNQDGRQQGQQDQYGQQQGQQNQYGQQQGQQNQDGQQQGRQDQQSSYGRPQDGQGQSQNDQESNRQSETASSSAGRGDWAEHQVRIQTVETRGGSASNDAPREQQPERNQPEGTMKGKRYAVGIGISNYKDESIGNLGICHVDAEKMLDLFKKRCGISENDTILLTNEKATLDNIRKIIKETLPKTTKPGDTVLIFWSGHGGRSEDKKHEFMIPYDGKGSDIDNTMLLDETFGRWIQELDGRKVLVVLDACHSGGQANSAKSLSKALDDDDDWQPLRFAFTRLALMKDIGQKDAAVIASSTSSEYSYVRKEKDLSVMTYYLIRAFDEAKTPLTHVKWCETIKPQVSQYVDKHFDGKKQTVVMQDDMAEPLVLNP